MFDIKNSNETIEITLSIQEVLVLIAYAQDSCIRTNMNKKSFQIAYSACKRMQDKISEDKQELHKMINKGWEMVENTKKV